MNDSGQAWRRSSPLPARGRAIAYDENKVRFLSTCDLSHDDVESLPLVGRVGRAEAMRSIVRQRRPGRGWPRARLPLWLTPTRLAQMKNLVQPPSPQGGGISPRQALVFICNRSAL